MDDAVCHRAGAIAGPCRVMTDGRGGNAEFLQQSRPSIPARSRPTQASLKIAVAAWSFAAK
jgi:hypothetical protein